MSASAKIGVYHLYRNLPMITMSKGKNWPEYHGKLYFKDSNEVILVHSENKNYL